MHLFFTACMMVLGQTCMRAQYIIKWSANDVTITVHLIGLVIDINRHGRNRRVSIKFDLYDYS